MNIKHPHAVTPEQAGSLHGLFLERVKRTPQMEAYRYFDSQKTAGNLSLGNNLKHKLLAGRPRCYAKICKLVTAWQSCYAIAPSGYFLTKPPCR